MRQVYMRRLRCLMILFVAPLIAVGHLTAETNDNTITQWIRKALREDSRIDTTAITIETQDGIVTLAGNVRDLAAKQYADLETKKISGVRGVVNTLHVMAGSRDDTDIAQDVRRRLANSASIPSQGLQVVVKEGAVTLDGVVASWAESQEAELLASEVKGVKSVANHLQVRYPIKRSPSDLQRAAAAAVARDVYLAGLPIKISITDDEARVEGKVATVYQKERASRDVRRVWNKATVQNNLKVVGHDSGGIRQQAPLPTDTQLQSSVQAELAADARLKPSGVTVQARQGEVTLHGSVPSYYQKHIAEQDTRDVVGVADVTNLLAVGAVHRPDDILQADVQHRLYSDAMLDTDVIDVQVKDDVVTLTGVVDSLGKKTHAVEVASRVKGIRQLVDHITVKTAVAYTNTSLKWRIRDWLAATDETRGVADQIHVAVRDGVATLTGRVNFWSERAAAGDVAFKTKGIQRVDNRLVVASTEGVK